VSSLKPICTAADADEIREDVEAVFDAGTRTRSASTGTISSTAWRIGGRRPRGRHAVGGHRPHQRDRARAEKAARERRNARPESEEARAKEDEKALGNEARDGERNGTE
jgi:hypothetical protein